MAVSSASVMKSWIKVKPMSSHRRMSGFNGSTVGVGAACRTAIFLFNFGTESEIICPRFSLLPFQSSLSREFQQTGVRVRPSTFNPNPVLPPLSSPLNAEVRSNVEFRTADKPHKRTENLLREWEDCLRHGLAGVRARQSQPLYVVELVDENEKEVADSLIFR